MSKAIEKYVGKCVYREILDEEFNKIVVSFSFHNSQQNLEAYFINVEFEPLGMVGQGEGWIWWSTDIHETDLLVFIKNFIGCSLDEIKCLPDYEKYYYGYYEFDDKDGKQSSLFENKYLGGFLFLPQLPNGTVWRIAPEAYKETIL
ncbi:TPA: hypothetical protein ACW0SX_002172 [Enterobacter soli]